MPTTLSASPSVNGCAKLIIRVMRMAGRTDADIMALASNPDGDDAFIECQIAEAGEVFAEPGEVRAELTRLMSA